MSDVIKKFDSVLSPATKETEKICGEIFSYFKENNIDYDFQYEDFIHDGVYVRSMFIPAGMIVLGTLLKKPTTLIIMGDCWVSNGDKAVRSQGFATLKGSPKRRSIFKAVSDTYLTMIAKVDAKTTKEAEEELTDELDILASRRKH